MREEGTVVAVEGNVARVRMAPGRSCGSCCACAVHDGQRELEITAEPPPPVGSQVVVEIGSVSPWLSTLLLFVLPLLGLVGGVIAGEHWRPFGLAGDAAPLVLGFSLLVLLFLVATLVDRVFLRKGSHEPSIVAVVPSGSQERA